MLGWNTIVVAILLQGMYDESCLQYKVRGQPPISKQDYVNTILLMGVGQLVRIDMELKRVSAFIDHMTAFFEPNRRTH
jgi:hypothetical protein